MRLSQGCCIHSAWIICLPPLKQAHVGFLQHIQFTNPVQSQAAKVKVVVTQTGAVQSTHAPITNGLTSKRQKIAIAIPRKGRIMGRPQGKASKKCLRRHATALSTPSTARIQTLSTLQNSSVISMPACACCHSCLLLHDNNLATCSPLRGM